MTIINIDTGTECPTCGDSSFEASSNMKKHHYHAHGESIGGATVSCDTCGDTHTRDIDEAKNYEHHFCDKNCRGEWHSDAYQDRLVEYIKTECYRCGEHLEMTPSKYRQSERKFCSQECENSWRSDAYTGTGSPNWNGGRGTWVKTDKKKYWIPNKNYGNWEPTRQKRLKVDNYKCKECKMTQEKHIEEYGCELHIHHDVPIRDFDDVSKANDIDNLVTLCASCHTIAEHN